MSNRLFLAMSLSAFAHEGQKYGKSDYYNSHILDVFGRVSSKLGQIPVTKHEDCLIVVYLHDVFEDRDIDLSVVESLFGDDVCNSVWKISKSHCYRDMNFDLVRTTKKNYLEYISNIKDDPIALLVKICDTEANLDASIADGNQKRVDKYKKQLELLNGKTIQTTFSL